MQFLDASGYQNAEGIEVGIKMQRDSFMPFGSFHFLPYDEIWTTYVDVLVDCSDSRKFNEIMIQFKKI